MAEESYGRIGISLKAEQMQDIREIAKQKLAEAIMAKGKRPEDYNITEILPKEDLGLSTEKFEYTFTAANDEENYVDQTVPDDKFIVVYGYTNTNANPATLVTKFYNGASIKKILHVQAAYAQQQPFMFFDPIVWSEGDSMKITLIGDSATTDNPVLLGLVATGKSQRLTS